MPRFYSICLIAFLSVCSPLSAGELAIGEVVPEFKGLLGTDGKLHGSADWKDAKVVVLAFTCNHCPVAASYQQRYADLLVKFKGQGVEFVAINTDATEDIESMKSHAKTAGMQFAYVDDADSAVSKAFGAKVTPHIFVLDQHRKLAYVGAFDDNANLKKVTQPYVADAVSAILAGKTPAITKTKPVGCGIQLKR